MQVTSAWLARSVCCRISSASCSLVGRSLILMTHQYLINIHGWEYLVLIGQVGLLQNLLCLVLTGRQLVLWSLHDDALHNRLLLSRGRYATANHLVMHPFKLHATTVIQTFNKLNHDWKINGEEQQQQQQQRRPFNGLWSGTTRVGRYQKWRRAVYKNITAIKEIWQDAHRSQENIYVMTLHSLPSVLWHGWVAGRASGL